MYQHLLASSAPQHLSYRMGEPLFSVAIGYGVERTIIIDHTWMLRYLDWHKDWLVLRGVQSGLKEVISQAVDSRAMVYSMAMLSHCWSMGENMNRNFVTFYDIRRQCETSRVAR